MVFPVPNGPKSKHESNAELLRDATLSGQRGPVSDKRELPGGHEGESMARGTFVILLARIFGLGCIFVTMYIVLPRVMPEGEFGNFRILMSFVVAFETALHYGLPAAVSKFIAEDRAFLGYFLTKGFWLQIWFSLILFGISLIIAPIATVFYKENFVFGMLFVLAMLDIPAYAIYNIRMSVLNGLRRFTKESITVLWYEASRTVMTVGGVLWAASVGRVDWMIPLALIANFLSSVVGLYWSVVYTRADTGYREEAGMVPAIIKFITPNIVAMFVYQALLVIDLWCVKGFITSSMTDTEEAGKLLGSYGLAGSIAIVPSLLYHSLYPALFPTISHYLGLGDIERVRRIIHQATKAGFIVLLPISIAMCGTSQEIFLVLVGQGYGFAWQYLGVLVFSMVAYTLYLSASIIIIASNHPEYPLKNVSCLLVGAFLLNWIFMKLAPVNLFGPADDPISRAMAGPVVAIVVGLIGTWFFARWIVTRYHVFAKAHEVARISLACLVPAPVLWFLDIPAQLQQLNPFGIHIEEHTYSLVYLLLGVTVEYLIYFICYSILLFLFGAFDPEEKKKILRLIRRERLEGSEG
jgi:O-antigen/teichoic acid export membrane protein